MDYGNHNPGYGNAAKEKTTSDLTCYLYNKQPVLMDRNVLNIENVHQCNCCMGYKTLHPLVSVIDLSKAGLERHTVKFGFYTVLLIEGGVDDFFFGRKSCDYSNASLRFLLPGEPFKIDKGKAIPRKGWLLAFHPDLICHTTLGKNLKNYSFLFYNPDESLHLSLREKEKAVSCLHCIEEELRHAIDCHSKILISRYIELFLDYCSRFYERQFITQCDANKAFIDQADRLLDEYIRAGKLKSGLFPSNEYFAGILRLSPYYFRDLLKFETGKSLNEYIESKRLDAAKRMLSIRENTVSMVAERLGYPNVQYFSRLFKKLTGTAPNEYRLIN